MIAALPGVTLKLRATAEVTRARFIATAPRDTGQFASSARVHVGPYRKRPTIKDAWVILDDPDGVYIEAKTHALAKALR